MAAIAGRTRRPDSGGVYASLGGRVDPAIHQLASDGAARDRVSIALYLERLVEADPLTRRKPAGPVPRRARVPSGNEVMLSGRVRPKVAAAAKKGAKARRVPIWRYLEILVQGAEVGKLDLKAVSPDSVQETLPFTIDHSPSQDTADAVAA
ncbi:hypothetical protein GCM10009733_021420 [Nonomuraea maheshkhaliensis]|uniref:Uncharacterized protein n=2 Tax=Nonomuraea maheshkhaliensis TaxID=419590 RepID=A0ABN2EZZ6_9ACTN